MTITWNGTTIKVYRTLTLVSLALLIMFSLHATSAESAQKPAGLRVLIMSGLNNHEWQSTTPLLVRMFRGCNRFGVVDVTEQPGKLNAKVLAKYDVVVSNWTP